SYRPGTAGRRATAGAATADQCGHRSPASYCQLARLCQPAAIGLAAGAALMAEVLKTVPHLCVVGHPNRGKSSIVSTLTENDSVRIGAESGTTKRADTFEFMIDQRVLL